MFRALALISLVAPALAFADADPKFAALRDKAEAVPSLGAFLDKYVGDCGTEPGTSGECQKNAAAYRAAQTGRKFYMIISEDQGTNLSMGPYNPNGDQMTIHLTPFFAGSNSAVSHGAPSKTDANGNPIMPFLPITGPIPQLGNMTMITRMLNSRQLRVQVVFTPQGLWTLPKKGGGKITGVKTRFDAVLITVGRSGDQIALWVNK